MTLEEAQKVADLWVHGPDGESCGYCAKNFAQEMHNSFPEFHFNVVDRGGQDYYIEVKPNEDHNRDVVS